MNALREIYKQSEGDFKERLQLVREYKEREHPIFDTEYKYFWNDCVLMPSAEEFMKMFYLQFYAKGLTVIKKQATIGFNPITLIYTVRDELINIRLKYEYKGYKLQTYFRDGFKIEVRIYSMPEIHKMVIEDVKDKAIVSKNRYSDYKRGKITMTRDKAAEYEAAIQVNGAVWNELSPFVQNLILGGASTIDHGVDVVGPNLELYQVKYYQDGSGIGNDAIAKLNNIAVNFEYHGAGFIPIRGIIIRRNTHLCRGIPAGDLIKVLYLDEEMKMDIPNEEIQEYSNEHKAALVELQNRIMAEIGNHQRQIYRIKMPTGTGKSYIIRRICQLYPNTRIYVFAPRILIVDELETLLSDLPNVYVGTLQSSENVHIEDSNFILIKDEAHYGEDGGNSERLDALHPIKTFLLSATLDNPDPETNITLTYAIQHKLICRPDVYVPVYATEPTNENIAQYLIEHPGASSVLVCHKNQNKAKEATRIMKLKGLDAETFVSDSDEKEGEQNFKNFKNGTLRILNAVLRVEMGVNIHRIDTIIFAYEWLSEKRLIQLIGRGTRFHYSKGSNFNIILPVSASQLYEKREHLFEALEEIYGPGQITKNINIELMDLNITVVALEDKDFAEYIREEAYTYDRRPLNENLLLAQYIEQKQYLRTKNIWNSKYYEELRKQFPEIYESGILPETYFKELGEFNYDDFLNRPAIYDKEQIEMRKIQLKAELRKKINRRNLNLSYDYYRDNDKTLPWIELK